MVQLGPCPAADPGVSSPPRTMPGCMHSRCLTRAVVLLVPLLACDVRQRRAERYADSLRAVRRTEWAAQRRALLAELPRREAQWRARGVGSYRFRAGYGSFWGGTVGDVIVREGAAPSVSDTLGRPLPVDARAVLIATVPAAFQHIRTVLADTSATIQVRFDTTYGFPSHVSVDDKYLSDTGYGHSISRFMPLTTGHGR